MEKKDLIVTRRQVLTSLLALSTVAIVGCNEPQPEKKEVEIVEPMINGVRFAVLGDWGIGSPEQLIIANQMYAVHRRRPFHFVLTVGDNIYPYGEGRYLLPIFERTYVGLLKDQIKFYATLGNHDVIRGRYDQINYPLFNMGGRSYYNLQQGNGLAEFFMLDSNSIDNEQLSWFETALKHSTAKWKFVIFHHPLYSSAHSHGSNLALRQVLEPLLVKYQVKMVFTGHDHTYERIFPQQGIQHFVTGGGGQVRVGDVELSSTIRAFSYDQGHHFMLVEVTDKTISFQAIGERGEVIDSGTVI